MKLIRLTMLFAACLFAMAALAQQNPPSQPSGDQKQGGHGHMGMGPGMNGLQLQSHIAAAGHFIPAIFITAYGTKESRRQAIEAGAVAFLAKPFRDEQLLRHIRSALQRDKM